jgi:hypothetical protein
MLAVETLLSVHSLSIEGTKVDVDLMEVDAHVGIPFL